MLKTWIGASLIGVIGMGIASAQMTPEEALQKMQERQAAATQPDVLQSEIHTLKSVIADQAKQIEALKAEIASLKQTIALAERTPAASANGTASVPFDVQPKSTYESRARKGHASASFIQQYKDLDAKIDAFASQNHIDPKITASLHEGDPKVGMTEDEVRLIARLTAQTESINGNIYIADGFGESETGWSHWVITIVNGQVTEIDKPTP
jgi:septal ring factor EnvC (AmiA/AmiB activator)